MLKAGYGIKDITPDRPVMLGGYDLRQEWSTGVHDPLSVRVLAIENEIECCLFLVLDFVGVPEYLVKAVRKQVSGAAAVNEEKIHLSAIHTHAGPETNFRSFENLNADYLEWVAGAAASAARMAKESMHEVTAVHTYTEVAGVGSYRARLREDSEYRMPCNTVVFKAVQPEYRDIVMSAYACHPTVLNESNYLISRDLVYGCEMRLKELLPQADLIFFNGACGDVSTRYTRTDASYEEVERLGGIWAEAVFQSLQHSEPLEECLWMEKTPLFIPPAEFFTGEEKAAVIAYLEKKAAECTDSQQRREYVSGRLALVRPDYGTAKGSLVELNVIGIGNIIICISPFELASVDAQRIVEEIFAISGRKAVFFCYSNGEESYLPTGRPLDRDSGYSDMMSVFRSDAKELVADAFMKIVRDGIKKIEM